MQSCGRNNSVKASKRQKIRVSLILYVIGVSLFLGNCSAWRLTPEESSLRGKAALRAGNYSQAKEYFESALKGGVDREENQVGLLRVLQETGEYHEAAKRAKEFLSVQEGSAMLYLEHGRISAAVGDHAAAEKSFRRSRILAGATGATVQLQATRELADLLEYLGRRLDAEVLWDQLIDEYRAGRLQGSQQLGIAAVAAWHRDYIQDAKDIFMDATSQESEEEVSLRALCDFGYLFLEKYNATDALSVFRDCLQINEIYPNALLGIALAKKYENNAEVEQYTRAALEVNPNLVAALDLLAELYLEEEYYEEALKEIDKALTVNPASLQSLSIKAIYYHLRGNDSGFTQTEKRILEINPSYGRFYYTMAENLVTRRKYREAVDFNRKAIALDPQLWAAYASLGMNLTRIGSLEEGRRAIQQAFEGDPFNVWAFNSLQLFDQMDEFARQQSEHFRFRMSKEDSAALSAHALMLAEEVYTKLTQRYGFVPKGPLEIELFPDHGGFAVRTLGLPVLGGLGVCFGKVVAMDSPRAHSIGTFNWGTTLWHEFTHVITLQMTNHNIPRWYSEGLSVYEERRARPGWGDDLTAQFVKAYKEGKLLKVSELSSGMTRPKFPEQVSLSYYQASLVCEMIEEKFGFEKIKESLELLAENKAIEEVFQQTLGWDAATMDEECERYLDTRLKKVASHLDFDRPAGAAESANGEGGRSPDKETLARQLGRNPADFFANLRMGTLLLKEGSNAEAETYLKKAQQLFPTYTEPGHPYQLLGTMYLENNREDEALAEFIAWGRIDENTTEPLLRAAEIYRQRKEWASAVKMLELSVYINPYDQKVQEWLGEAAMKAEDWSTAITAYRVLVGLNTTDPAGVHYELARAWLASGQIREAKRETLRALEIAPSFVEAQELLLKIAASDEGPTINGK